MEKDVLSQVIDVEKEIQKCLEAEKAKARQWLEQARKELDETFLAEQKKITEDHEQYLAEADRHAAEKADAIITQASRAAERLGNLNPEILRSIVKRRVCGIVPG